MEGLPEGFRGDGRRDASLVLQPLGDHGPDSNPLLTQFLHLPVGEVTGTHAWDCFQNTESRTTSVCKGPMVGSIGRQSW